MRDLSRNVAELLDMFIGHLYNTHGRVGPKPSVIIRRPNSLSKTGRDVFSDYLDDQGAQRFDCRVHRETQGAEEFNYGHDNLHF